MLTEVLIAVTTEEIESVAKEVYAKERQKASKGSNTLHVTRHKTRRCFGQAKAAQSPCGYYVTLVAIGKLMISILYFLVSVLNLQGGENVQIKSKTVTFRKLF